MSILYNLLRRFVRDEKGSVLVEGIMVLPMFVWAYAGLFVYWDSYRSINTVQKVSYTISDLISRTQAPLNDAFIGGIRGTMNLMLDAGQTGELRVTSYRWSDANNRFEVIFSRSPGNALPELTDAGLAGLTARLPAMSDGDSAVLVETAIPYTPPMAFGLSPTTIRQFIVTRPRFLPKVCHVSFPC